MIAAMRLIRLVVVCAHVSFAYPSMWWANWRPNGGCSPPEPGDFMMGNTAVNGSGTLSLKEDKAGSYLLELSSSSPSGHLLHVSSGQLASPSSGSTMSCSGRSVAWNFQ